MMLIDVGNFNSAPFFLFTFVGSFHESKQSNGTNERRNQTEEKDEEEAERKKKRQTV